jgi:hypothetical protein
MKIMKKNYVITIISLLVCFVMQAQTYQTWRSDSGTGDNSWQNSANWWNFPDASPIVFGQQEWDNNHLPAQVNSAELTTWRFLFKAGATDTHTFTGSQINFFDFGDDDPQIINDSSGNQIINNLINGDPDASDPFTLLINNTGNLEFGGAINNQGWMDINGSTGTATTITFNEIISGAGGVTKENSNISIVYKDNNSYAGQTNLNAGTLTLEGSLVNSDVIVGGSGTLIIAENATLKSLTVAAGGIVTVTAGKSLTIINNFVNNGTSFTANHGSSLLVNGTSTGNITYQRSLNFVSGNTNGWYLVSSPVVGQVYNDAFATSNGLATNSPRRGIATYDDAASAGSKWDYLQSNDSNAGTFTSGSGYSFKRQSTDGIISFIGALNTTDVSVPVFTAGNGFNLLGNPYTSYISSGSFLTDNTANLVSETIWVWDHIDSEYDTYVAGVGTNFSLAPGQGFFIKASTASNLNFAETNQSSGTGDTFQKTSQAEIALLMNDGTNSRTAIIYYLDNASTGFDNGFDGEAFGGIVNTTDIFTHLLENSQGKNYKLQSLPNKGLETMVIPVGVKAAANKEITFSANANNLPTDLKVFLEDRLTKTFTRLDETNSSFKVTLSEAVNGIGRFYLHTKTSSVLSTDNVVVTNISMYKTNASTLRITGLSQGKTSVKLFNMLGKQVLNTSFTSNGLQDITLPTLATGVYIVQLETAQGNLNKKITLE